MARSSMVVASLMLVLLAVAHGAEVRASLTFNRRLQGAMRAKQTGVSSDGAQLEPITSAIPDSVSNFNIASIEPLLPLLDPKVVDPKLLAEVATVVPLLKVDWLKAILPYVTEIDPDNMGILLKALFPLLKQVDNKSMLEYIKVIKEVNPNTVVALGPALGKLDMRVVGRLIDTVNAMQPDMVVTLANVAASITPQTWDCLIKLVELGVPAINLAGSKLSMIPITVPAPAAYSGSHFPNVHSIFGH